jgi:hypothetical protein
LVNLGNAGATTQRYRDRERELVAQQFKHMTRGCFIIEREASQNRPAMCEALIRVIDA